MIANNKNNKTVINNITNNNKSKLWIYDINNFINKDNFFEIWPCENSTREEKINSITRLILYLTILGIILTKSTKVLISGIIAIITLLITYFILNKKRINLINKITTETFSNENMYEKVKNNFTNPNTINPNMNVLLPEIYDNPDREPAAPAYNKAVEDKINNSVKNMIKKNFDDENIDEKLFKSNDNFSSDELVFQQSMRQFYTTANTRIPNNQKEFAKFCYGNLASCKDGDSEQCLRNNSRYINI